MSLHYSIQEVKRRTKTDFYIRLSYSYKGMRVRRLADIAVIDITKWDKKKERFKTGTNQGAKHSTELNRYLQVIQEGIESFEYKHKAENNIPDLNDIENYIDNLIKPKPEAEPEAEKNFLECYWDFIEATKRGDRRSNNGQPIKLSTCKAYVTTYNDLKIYSEMRNKVLTFDSMNKEFYSGFMKYMSEHNCYNSEEKLSMNFQGVNIKNIKTFLHYAIDKGYTTNLSFIKMFKVQKKDPDMIVLSEEELGLLETYEPKSKSMQFTRDCFLAQIYTGLRYSDLANLKPQNFDKVSKEIKITMIKTEGQLRIPIGKKLLTILEQYTDWTLPTISNQKYNSNIKDLCRDAGINTPTTVVQFRGNERVDVTKPKWEFISSHTARRSLITLSLKKGVLPEIVMKISGHKNRASFQKYVRITQDEAIEKMRDII